MISVLAHHVEAQHVPVLLAIFAAGAWMGWQLVSKWLTRTDKTGNSPAGPSAD